MHQVTSTSYRQPFGNLNFPVVFAARPWLAVRGGHPRREARIPSGDTQSIRSNWPCVFRRRGRRGGRGIPGLHVSRG